MAESANLRTIKININGDSRSLESAVDRAKTSLKGFDKKQKETANFASKIAKILEYRFIRGGISKIMQGLEEGKKAIDAYDKALNGLSASKASTFMKEMAENTTLLQNTMASLFMTVYAAVRPAILALVEVLRSVMNTINQVVSALMGRTMYTKAVKGWNSMTEAAKAYKKQIFGFDELNILKAPSGDNADAFGGAFEEAEVAEPLKGIAGVMDTIIGKVKEVAGLIDWDDVWEKVGMIGGAIALWKVSESLLTFMKSITGNPTYQIAIGATLMIAGIEGLEDAMMNAITEGLTPKNVSGMLLSTGAIILGGLLVGKALGDAVLGGCLGALVAGGLMLWTGIRSALEKGLSPASAFLIVAGLGIIGAVFSVLNPAISMAMGGVWGIIAGAIVALGIYIVQHWKEITDTLKEGWNVLKTNFMVMVGEIAQGWHDITQGFAEWFAGFKPKVEAALTAFWGWIKLGFETLWYAVTHQFEVLGNDISEAWKTAVSSLTEQWEKLKNNAARLFQPIVDIIDKVKSGWDAVKGVFGGNGSMPNIRLFANGGYPSTGDLFIANEAGPELVGSFGNRTGVYNQEQFAGAMAAANQQVVNAVLAIGSQITGAVNNKPVPSVRIGDRDIFNASQRGASLVGNSLIQGAR